MTHPGADMGLEWPSLLTWKKTAKTLDHIVLGKGEPGGTWPVSLLKLNAWELMTLKFFFLLF